MPCSSSSAQPSPENRRGIGERKICMHCIHKIVRNIIQKPVCNRFRVCASLSLNAIYDFVSFRIRLFFCFHLIILSKDHCRSIRHTTALQCIQRDCRGRQKTIRKCDDFKHKTQNAYSSWCYMDVTVGKFLCFIIFLAVIINVLQEEVYQNTSQYYSYTPLMTIQEILFLCNIFISFLSFFLYKDFFSSFPNFFLLCHTLKMCTYCSMKSLEGKIFLTRPTSNIFAE